VVVVFLLFFYRLNEKKSGIGQIIQFREDFGPRKAFFGNSGYGPARIWGCREPILVDLIRFGAKITGGNEIPPGSGSFVDPLSGILKDLESSKANFAESLSAATGWGAADLVSKMVDLVKIGKNPIRVRVGVIARPPDYMRRCDLCHSPSGSAILVPYH